MPSVVPARRVHSVPSAKEILPPVLVVTALVAAYGRTLAPGLTWANGGSDGGDLIAAAATGGVAHPTGYPVYLVLAQLFQLMPVGSLAFRTNLLSAFSTVGAALLVFLIVKRALATAGQPTAALGGVVSALGLGLAPIVWSQAVITEVYALNLFFTALLLCLLTAHGPRSRALNALSGVLQGLAVGNQILAALLVPATLAMSATQPIPAGGAPTRSWRWHFAALRDSSLGLLAGLCSYAILPLRAISHPAVDWGGASSLQGFWWLVSGSLYQPELLQFSLTALWEHLLVWASLLLQQFGVAGLAMALVGLVVFFRGSRLYLLTLWIAIAFTIFALQYNVVDSRVYLLPVYLAFSIWIGLGVGECVHSLTQRWARASWLFGAVCVLYLALQGFQTWPQVDASRENGAETYGRLVMTAAPPHAILFAQGDQAVFTLWYFHYALRERQDVAVVAADLLPLDWYRENLKHTYPGLVLPVSISEPWLLAVRNSNPERPACYPNGLDSFLNCQ